MSNSVHCASTFTENINKIIPRLQGNRLLSVVCTIKFFFLKKAVIFPLSAQGESLAALPNNWKAQPLWGSSNTTGRAQPEPYWDSRGRGRLTVVGKGGELCSPSLSHKISTSLPGSAEYSHYYNHQVLLCCPHVLPTSSAWDRQTQRRNVNTESEFYALRMSHLATWAA